MIYEHDGKIGILDYKNTEYNPKHYEKISDSYIFI